MPSYKITLHSGLSFTAIDKRDLHKLSADLCSAGFVVIDRQGSGYSTEAEAISVLERAVMSIDSSV